MYEKHELFYASNEMIYYFSFWILWLVYHIYSIDRAGRLLNF